MKHLYTLIKVLLVSGILVLGACGVIMPSLAQAEVPAQASHYRQDLTRQARLVWGLDAPVALFAAQIHQESSWNPRAISPAGAQGIAQFMPATATWMQEMHISLRGGDVFNPTWSFRALAEYDHWLFTRLKGATPCDQWAMALAGYNGGLGWVLRDKALAASNGDSRWQWWGHVENHNAGRSAANFRENRHYPRRILLVLLPRYSRAGWGQEVCL